MAHQLEPPLLDNFSNSLLTTPTGGRRARGRLRAAAPRHAQGAAILRLTMVPSHHQPAAWG